eukprot:TRINITY_DN46877_c0_g1_i1.p1 TRINITY_DN46877_c0_g1~~TRINITY_DN46877_c0_g1_i1.p1  ORF type:complete len:274 (-),score=48.39 TRINITY_DN46877_c0_g1_i1:115-936(-)
MVAAEVCLSTIVAVCQTYEGRDKLVRFFQFGSRAVMGSTARRVGSFSGKVNDDARTLMVNLAGARRAFRWGRELPVLLSLQQTFKLPDLADQALDFLQKTSLLMFFFIDHVGWLIQTFQENRRGLKTIQLGLKYLVVSSVIAVVSGARKLRRSLVSANHATIQERTSERNKNLFTIIRNGLLALQVAHLSRWWETSDVLVGTLGMVTSIMDIAVVWPQRMPVAAKAQIAQREQTSSSGASEDSAKSKVVPSEEVDRGSSKMRKVLQSERDGKL